MSVTDVKLHLSNTISNTESGKRVSQAVASTGRAVVGGITTAKGAFSSWITSFKSGATTANNDNNEQSANDGSGENGGGPAEEKTNAETPTTTTTS